MEPQTGRDGARRSTREAEGRTGLSQWGPGSAGLQGRLQGVGNLGLGEAASWGCRRLHVVPYAYVYAAAAESRSSQQSEATLPRESLCKQTSDYVTAHSQQRKGGRAPGCQGDANGSISLQSSSAACP